MKSSNHWESAATAIVLAGDDLFPLSGTHKDLWSSPFSQVPTVSLQILGRAFNFFLPPLFTEERCTSHVSYGVYHSPCNGQPFQGAQLVSILFKCILLGDLDAVHKHF